MIADIIVILLTSWIVGDTVVKAILLIDTNADILEIIYYIFARPWVYFYLFTLSGILAKIYFSRYYGVIISNRDRTYTIGSPYNFTSNRI